MFDNCATPIVQFVFYLFKSTTILVAADTASSSINTMPWKTTEELMSLCAFTHIVLSTTGLWFGLDLPLGVTFTYIIYN